MFCFWCEMGTVPKNLREKGFVWIHQKCFIELIELRDDFKGVKEILEGKRNEEIEIFLERMRKFDERWKKLETLNVI